VEDAEDVEYEYVEGVEDVEDVEGVEDVEVCKGKSLKHWQTGNPFTLGATTTCEVEASAM
jgi:hypothetical protein